MRLYIILILLACTASGGLVSNAIHLRDKLSKLRYEYDSRVEERITNGQLAVVGQFPYQVGVNMSFGELFGWCGGTLISDRWIITAAHCVDGAESATVYLGTTDIYDINEKGQQRVFCSKKYITIHERWKPLFFSNDIALIKLPSPIDFNDNIQPATLPKKGESYSTYEDEMAIASGWGRDSDATDDVSQFLRFIEVPIMSKTACNRYYFGYVTSKMICINTKDGKNICSGDSGGPLVIKEGNANYLIGTTSFGIIFGCEVGWPAVFTRITSYLDWIEAKTGVVNL